MRAALASPIGLRLRAYALPLVVLVAVWIYISSTTDTFRGDAAFFSVLEGFPLMGLVALGLAVTIIAGELDLSVGSMAAVAGAIAVRTADVGLVGAIAIAVAVGVILGAIQGGLIARIGINSLVFTIGTLILLRGVAWLLCDNAPLPLEDVTVSDPLLERYGIFSPASITALIVFALVGLFLAYTRYGREIYAIGGARAEAAAAGVPRTRPLVVAFAVSGGLASMAGALATMRGGSAAPENYADLLLAGAAAALLGGISLYGGKGTVINVAFGVAILTAVTAGLAARGEPNSTVQLVTGVLLLLVIAVEFTAARVVRRSSLASDRASPKPTG
jgi:ribose/xylose/arabinose/galactoside ABC-type transport system permease subunit